MNAPALQVRPVRPRPLAQVELLVLFHPGLQSGGPNTQLPQDMKPAARCWLSVDVFGRIGKGELTGKPVVEDMRLEANGEDVSELLEPLADGIASYVTGIL